jgi:hypothetical protein
MIRYQEIKEFFVSYSRKRNIVCHIIEKRWLNGGRSYYPHYNLKMLNTIYGSKEIKYTLEYDYFQSDFSESDIHRIKMSYSNILFNRDSQFNVTLSNHYNIWRLKSIFNIKINSKDVTVKSSILSLLNTERYSTLVNDNIYFTIRGTYDDLNKKYIIYSEINRSFRNKTLFEDWIECNNEFVMNLVSKNNG